MGGIGGRSLQGIISPREVFCVCLLAYFTGAADHAVMVAGGLVCVNKVSEVAVVRPVGTGWSAAFLLLRYWAYAMISGRREIGRLE